MLSDDPRTLTAGDGTGGGGGVSAPSAWPMGWDRVCRWREWSKRSYPPSDPAVHTAPQQLCCGGPWPYVCCLLESNRKINMMDPNQRRELCQYPAECDLLYRHRLLVLSLNALMIRLTVSRRNLDETTRNLWVTPNNWTRPRLEDILVTSFSAIAAVFARTRALFCWHAPTTIIGHASSPATAAAAAEAAAAAPDARPSCPFIEWRRPEGPGPPKSSAPRRRGRSPVVQSSAGTERVVGVRASRPEDTTAGMWEKLVVQF